MLFRAQSAGLTIFACVAAFAVTLARADVQWSGLGTNVNWTNPANWQGNAAPTNDGNEQIVFGSATRTSVLVNTSQSIRGLRFDFSSGPRLVYSLSGTGGSTLTLGGNGIEVRGASLSATVSADSRLSSILSSATGGAVTFASSLGVVLGASQTWTVDSDSSLDVAGVVSGSGRLTLSGGGQVSLSGNNTYSGGTVLETVTLGIESNTALGTGSVTVNGTATVYSNSGARTLANALNLNSSLLELLPYGGEFRLTGPVTLGASTTVRNSGLPVFFSNAIGEIGASRALTVSGEGAVVLSGVNTYTGGTAVLGGYLFFNTASSVPATGALSNAAQGYTGILFNTGVQSGFVSKFSVANTFGTLGFDTPTASASPTTFTEALDMSSFNASARIGTTTRATFSPTAAITPSVLGGYRFGGGGGTVTVESRLTGTNALTVDSSSGLPLMVHLTNVTNDYSGTTSATHSALVFGAGAASLNSTTGSFSLGTGGYIGTQDLALVSSSWISKFAASTTTGVIGFDVIDVSNPIVVGSIATPIDLTRFNGTGPSIALGTSSAAILAGTIILPGNQADYHLTGYKGGWLTVSSSLSGVHGLKIGDASGNYPEFDPSDFTRMSTVFLNGSNTHSGGTTLFSGKLVIGNTTALGTGALTVDGSGANVVPRLETSLASNPTFSNQLIVKDSFEIEGVNSFGWSGNIVNGTTTGTIQKSGASTLTLTGNNSGFSGGFSIDEGTIIFASNTAAGTGGLNLGSSNGAATFNSAAPTINSLGGGSATSILTLGTGTTLTINQTSSSTFRGQVQGAGGITKTGGGTLQLESAGSFTGGTLISAGAVDVAATGALGTGLVTLNGTTSRLKVDAGVTLANSIVFGTGGGRLSGNGTFSSNVVIGANSAVAPGNSVGTLAFTSGLTLASGGTYDFEIQNVTATPGVGWDHVQVTGPLTFTATVISPFTLNLISLNNGGANGNVANFVSGNAYSWSIASASSFLGFNSSAITLNTTAFTSGLNGGSFSLSTSGTSLLLNFTPVPEPSTWAMLFAGLGVVGFRALRRRR